MILTAPRLFFLWQYGEKVIFTDRSTWECDGLKESEDGEKSSALEEETSSTQDEDMSSPEDEVTLSSEDDSNTTDEEYQPVPDSSSSGEEDNTDTAMEAEQMMAETEELAGEWMSRHGKIMWFPTAEETLHYNPVSTGITPGPTLYAVVYTSNLRSAFDLFITEETIQLLCTHANLHGRQRCEDWGDVDEVEMRTYIGILILAVIYRSRHEATRSMWDAKTGRAMFRATMALFRYTQISANVCFDDRLSPARFRNDKLAAFRILREKWVARLPLLFNPGVDVFRGAACCIERLLWT